MRTIVVSLFSFSVLALVASQSACVGGSSDDDDQSGGACVPEGGMAEVPESDPACEQCVRSNCANAVPDCSGPCGEYWACTCDCEQGDAMCVSACADQKSAACGSCEQEGGDELVACVQAQCSDACLGGPGDPDSPDDSGASGWTGASGSPEDSGASGWSDDSGDSGWPGSSSDSGWPGDSGDDTDSGDSGSACAELAACCPGLDDPFDRELCETADDPYACELWLDVFRDEGLC